MLTASLICFAACGDRPTTAEKESAARSQITEIVKDPQRQHLLLAQVDRWDALLTEKARSEADFITRRDALNANYAATVADFQTLQQQHAAEVQKLSADFVVIRQTIIANTTEDEWNALRAARDELRQATATPTVETGAKP
jgi:hypothetical protein